MAAKRHEHPWARAAVVRLPGRPNRAVHAGRLLPTGRSLVAGVAVLAVGVGGYVAARTTSAFAVTEIEVRGAPPPVAGEVRKALEPLLGRSLLDLRGGAVEARAEAIPTVAGVSSDRAFPNTLVVYVRPEQPIAVLRRGAESWLLSARGRVLRPLARGSLPRFPRVWVAETTTVAVGERLSDAGTARALRVLVPLAHERFPARIRTVRVEAELTVVLASGLELRLGDETDLALKLAVASRIVPTLAGATTGVSAYLDVSVPERPVAPADLNSQVEL
jgi:cell division septal protein FtsQ